MALDANLVTASVEKPTLRNTEQSRKYLMSWKGLFYSSQVAGSQVKPSNN